MTDNTGIHSGIDGEALPICRVAYTINNHQPVMSTIIGDQPLFYMDFDIQEDDEFMDAADLKILEDELLALKAQIQKCDETISETSFCSEKRAQQFREDAVFISQQNKEAVKDEKIADLIRTLESSRLAKSFLEFAKDHCIEIKFSKQAQDAFYDRKTGLILINPDIDETTQILLAARELRRHWHHRQGALIHPLLFQPDNAILIHRSQQADLSIAMIRVAWELQLSGYNEAWEHLEDSTMQDLCQAFAREAYLDFRTVNNGFASASVFETWFLSDRCRFQDKGLIQNMLTDHQGYVFSDSNAMQHVTTELITALGSMPYGKNYLAEHAFTIMNDPIFTEVRDRSNANFLWFIKFERSFKEAEQELQPKFEPAARGVLPSAMNPKDQDRNDATEEESNIVTIYDNSPQSGDRKSKRKLTKSEQDKSADIIYLGRGNGSDQL